jgi:hypothetical protein
LVEFLEQHLAEINAAIRALTPDSRKPPRLCEPSPAASGRFVPAAAVPAPCAGPEATGTSSRAYGIDTMFRGEKPEFAATRQESRAESTRILASAAQAGDKTYLARKSAAAFAIFTALSMLIGAFIASAAAAYGGSQRDEHP